MTTAGQASVIGELRDSNEWTNLECGAAELSSSSDV